MPNGATPEQEAMAMEFAAGRQRGQKIEKTLKATGRTAQAAGKTAEIAGAGAEVSGKAMKAGGRAVRQAGSQVTKAGAELSSTGLGAIAGVPMMAAGGVMFGGGAAAEAGGRAAEFGGKAMKKGGSQLSEFGKQAKKAKEEMFEQKMPGADIAERAGELATKKLQAKLAAAAGPEEAQLRMAQIKRAAEAAKKIKKIVRLGSAAGIVTIIYLILAYFKDYLLGNIIGNGDPSGVFAKKEANFFGYKVTPLSFPEVLLLWTVLYSMGVNFLYMWGLPLLIVGFIIVVASGGGGAVADALAIAWELTKAIGLEIFDVLAEALGISLSALS